MEPYYQDELVTLFHGDCREITAWCDADVLVVDPPYGRSARQDVIRSRPGRSRDSRPRTAITGDRDTSVRDTILDLWGADRRGYVFGDPLIPPPAGAIHARPYLKPPDAGARGARGGVRRDWEVVYMTGRWPTGIGGVSALLTTAARCVGSPYGIAAVGGHQHAKPLDLMVGLLEHIGPGVVADPCAGGGGTVLAAVALGRRVVAVEVEERYCETIARRLSQAPLFGGAA